MFFYVENCCDNAKIFEVNKYEYDKLIDIGEKTHKTLENTAFTHVFKGFMMVGATGFEPAAPWSQTRCATKLRHAPTYLSIIYPFFYFVNTFCLSFEYF